MRTLKYGFIPLLVLLLCASSLLLAQPRGMNVDQRVKMLTERLSLTEEQAKKAKEIFTATQNEMQKARDEGMEDRDAMRQKMQDIMKKNDAAIEKILTPSQKKEYAKLREEQQQRLRERMGPPPSERQ